MDLKREIDPENPDVLVVQKIIEDRIDIKDVENEISSILDRIKQLESEGKDKDQEYTPDAAIERVSQLRSAVALKVNHPLKGYIYGR